MCFSHCQWIATWLHTSAFVPLVTYISLCAPRSHDGRSKRSAWFVCLDLAAIVRRAVCSGKRRWNRVPTQARPLDTNDFSADFSPISAWLWHTHSFKQQKLCGKSAQTSAYQKFRVACLLQSAEGSWHKRFFFLRDEFSHEKCSEIFPGHFEPFVQAQKKNPNLNFWVRIFSGGVGVFHVKGWGPKSSVCPSKPREWRDIPGFCRDIPEAPEKFEKKMFGFNSRPLFVGLEESCMFPAKLPSPKLKIHRWASAGAQGKPKILHRISVWKLRLSGKLVQKPNPIHQ